MFAGDIDDKLHELNKNIIFCDDSFFDLSEKMDPNHAIVRINLSNPSILFKCANNQNTAKFFKNRKCADFIVLEQGEKNTAGKWNVHIFEFKRKIKNGKDAWPDHIMMQFAGAYFNSLCLAGFFNVCINNVFLYTCYRFDMISGSYADPAFLRLSTHNPGEAEGGAIVKWESKNIMLHTEFADIECEHKRIHVNEEFYSQLSI